MLDPVDGDGVEERIRALGEPAGVVRMLDRHSRDCEAFARRLGVPLYDVPFDGVQGAPFEAVPVVRLPRWKEVALWFADERTLVCADVLTNAVGYKAASERIGVHPFLRLKPPGVLRDYDVRHLLLGHGEGLHGDDVPDAIDEALNHPWTRTPNLAVAQVRNVLGRVKP